MTFRAGKQRNSMRKALSCIIFPIYCQVCFQISTISITVWFEKYWTLVVLSNQPFLMCLCLQVSIHKQRSAHIYIHIAEMLKQETQKWFLCMFFQVSYLFVFMLYHLENPSTVARLSLPEDYHTTQNMFYRVLADFIQEHHSEEHKIFWFEELFCIFNLYLSSTVLES